MARSPKEASPATVAALAEARERYPLDDVQDFTDAGRGLIAPLPGSVLGDDGHVIFDVHGMDYIEGDGAGFGGREPVAAVEADPSGRPVQGRRRGVPGAWQRHRATHGRRR